MGVLLLTLLSFSGGTAENEQVSLPIIRTSISQAYDAIDTQRLANTARQLEALHARSGESWSLYYLGLCHYRILNCLNMEGRNGWSWQGKHVEAAIDALEKIGENSPFYAEACILLQGLYGRKLGMKPLSGMTLLHRMNKVADQARRLVPGNPRRILMEAVQDFHAPKAWGGDKDRARLGFQRAVELLKTQAPQSNAAQGPGPDWGLEDAWAWLGIVYADQGNPSMANRCYAAALACNPNFGWVRRFLLAKAGS
jgi:tetratricopeptide (TPR) repeat protein